jgi:hypothetical protein
MEQDQLDTVTVSNLKEQQQQRQQRRHTCPHDWAGTWQAL